jgi:hypothetical protein
MSYLFSLEVAMNPELYRESIDTRCIKHKKGEGKKGTEYEVWYFNPKGRDYWGWGSAASKEAMEWEIQNAIRGHIENCKGIDWC